MSEIGDILRETPYADYETAIQGYPLEDLLDELSVKRLDTANAYFMITYDPKKLTWVISMPQAGYRLDFRNDELRLAVIEAIKWINSHRVAIREQYRINK